MLWVLALAALTPGDFQGEGDVGQVHAPGSARLVGGEYRLTGGGENMWEARDAFHYLGRKVAGDLVLTAAVRFPEKKGDEHRKAGWWCAPASSPTPPMPTPSCTPTG